MKKDSGGFISGSVIVPSGPIEAQGNNGTETEVKKKEEGKMKSLTELKKILDPQFFRLDISDHDMQKVCALIMNYQDILSWSERAREELKLFIEYSDEQKSSIPRRERVKILIMELEP